MLLVWLATGYVERGKWWTWWEQFQLHGKTSDAQICWEFCDVNLVGWLGIDCLTVGPGKPQWLDFRYNSIQWYFPAFFSSNLVPTGDETTQYDSLRSIFSIRIGYFRICPANFQKSALMSPGWAFPPSSPVQALMRGRRWRRRRAGPRWVSPCWRCFSSGASSLTSCTSCRERLKERNFKGGMIYIICYKKKVVCFWFFLGTMYIIIIIHTYTIYHNII